MKEIRKAYERDFKLKAVMLSYENGSLAQTARDLNIHKNLLFHWRKEFKEYGTRSFPGYGYLKLNSEEKKITISKKKSRKQI